MIQKKRTIQAVITSCVVALMAVSISYGPLDNRLKTAFIPSFENIQSSADSQSVLWRKIHFLMANNNDQKMGHEMSQWIIKIIEK